VLGLFVAGSGCELRIESCGQGGECIETIDRGVYSLYPPLLLLMGTAALYRVCSTGLR